MAMYIYGSKALVLEFFSLWANEKAVAYQGFSAELRHKRRALQLFHIATELTERLTEVEKKRRTVDLQ